MRAYRHNTFDEIIEMRQREEERDLFKGKAPKFQHDFSGFEKDKKLFNCRLSSFGESRFTIDDGLTQEDFDKVLSSVDRAGSRLPYQCELYPSSDSQRSPNMNSIGTAYPFDIDDSKIKSTSFEEWFYRWLDDRILVPDTCILLEHYLSNVLLPRLKQKIQIKIPRFVILELEAISSRERASKLSKRQVFSAFNELRNLRLNYGASVFPSPVKANLLADFSSITGSKRADSFIRLEIWEEMERIGASDTRNRQMVLLTRDMVMACTASAENIDTFYLSPGLPMRRIFYQFNISKIITELAITFNEIRIEDFVEENILELQGMWSGKSIFDWQKGNLRFAVISQKKDEQ